MLEIDLDEFVDGYIEAALWAGHDYRIEDDSGNFPPWDENFHGSDVANRGEVRAMCATWVAANRADLEAYLESERLPSSSSAGAGHDFLLTRDGHGAGFWDRYYGPDKAFRDVLLRLTEAAQLEGEQQIDAEDGEDARLFFTI